MSTLVRALGCLALIAGIAAPQVDFGTITGTVTDPSGAAVPSVQVSILQTETNFRFQTVTNSEGIYRVQSLQPGTYQITFAIAGFKRLVRDNVTLQTGAVLPVNATLEVGSASESVQVTGQATLLETEMRSYIGQIEKCTAAELVLGA